MALISKFGFSLLSVIAFSVTAEAKVFRNAYVSFELPEKWDCVLEQTEWVCRTKATGIDNREAIIILTAKEVGPSDSLPAYESHLKSPRVIMNRSNQPLSSQVLKVEQRNIAKHPWIDGMHMSSEVPSYYTRYLATTKEKIAVLVTFSAHKAHYTKYSADFFRAIESLRVIASAFSKNGAGNMGPGGDGMFGGPLAGGLMAGMEGELPPEDGEAGGFWSGTGGTLLIFAIIMGLVGAYLLVKRRKR